MYFGVRTYVHMYKPVRRSLVDHLCWAKYVMSFSGGRKMQPCASAILRVLCKGTLLHNGMNSWCIGKVQLDHFTLLTSRAVISKVLDGGELFMCL